MDGLTAGSERFDCDAAEMTASTAFDPTRRRYESIVLLLGIGAKQVSDQIRGASWH